ncbi:MAG: glycosyl hydrolase, partial [Planctomycetaceae bacterium]|nr:glycosyl hydrolase [Planctomycetaceae bacterium]
NLLEFLTKKGKYVPLDLRKAVTVVSTKPMFYGVSPVERLIFDDWSPKTVGKVPYVLIDPKGDRVPNTIMLHGPQGEIPPTMPKEVTMPVNAPAKAIHILGGIRGWSFPAQREQSTSIRVRLHYADGTTEDHDLKNGVHFADYIRRIDVPGSEFAFDLDGRQIRTLAIEPKRSDEVITQIDLVKGNNDRTAPIVMAITVETP